MSKIYDVIIIGGGPSGVSSALYTTRANLSTLVIDSGKSSLSNAEMVDNFYGQENPVEGLALLEKGINHIKRLNAGVIKDEAVSVSLADALFEIETAKNGAIITKSLIIATGKPRKKPKIEGFEALEGRGISYCAICDGFFYRNKRVGVLGSGEYALNEASDLSNVTEDVTIFTNHEKVTFKNNIYNIVTGKITKVLGTNRLEGVEFEDGSVYSLDGLFIALGSAGASDFAKKLGIFTTDKGEIMIDNNGMTNIKGIFAAGDCCGGLLQVAKAVGEGAVAGAGVVKYIKTL